MTDLELLFLVLAVIYGWECVCWLPRGAVAFRSWTGRTWGLARGSVLFGNQRGGFTFAHPLPPLGALLAAGPWPISFSPEGIIAAATSSVDPAWRPSSTGRFLRFQDIKEVTVSGKKVLVNGEHFVKAASAPLALELAEAIKELLSCPPNRRRDEIKRRAAKAFDTNAIEDRWRTFHAAANPVRTAANVFFGYLVILVPVAFAFIGFKRCWHVALAVLLASTFSLAWLFRRVHKQFFLLAEDERFSHFLIILLSPATAIRTHDLLSRSLLESFHPLAIAKILCPAPKFEELARQVLLEVRHPAPLLATSAEPGAEATRQHARQVFEETLTAFLNRNGMDPLKLLRPPARTDESCKSYCPRCLAQFTSTDGVCTDCGGLALVTFPSADRGAKD